MPHLEQWSLCYDRPYAAPEVQCPFFDGIITDHPKIEDGQIVSTSSLVGFDIETEEFVTKSGNHYTLGEPRGDYEEQFPNARERMYEQGRKLALDMAS